MEPIVIFIDNSNIFQGFKKYNIKVDYEKLKNVITKNRKLHKIILYEGVIYPMKPEKRKWYRDLKNKSGYIIKTSFDKITRGARIEKKVDIKIAIDMISLAYEKMYDTAVLVSGDGDFIPVIKKLKKMNKIVEIWGFKYSTANTLKEELERENINYIDDIIEKIKI